MKKNLVALILIILASSTEAASWGLFPTSQTVGVGQPFQMDLVVSGLGDGIAPSLGGFDIDITFDDVFTIDPNSVVFGPFLGDPNNPSETQTTATLVNPEVLFLRESSLLDVSTLDAIQGSSFTLAALTFTGSSTGTFSFWGDDYSGGLFLTDGRTLRPGLDGATVTVAALPEPATVWLLGLGLIGLIGIARRKNAA